MKFLSIIIICVGFSSCGFSKDIKVKEEENTKNQSNEVNGKNKDIYIGHLYEEKGDTFARPLFYRTPHEWEAIIANNQVGNRPDDLKKAVDLFPQEVTWHLYHNFQNIQTFTAYNPEKYKGWSNIGAASVENVDMPDIEVNTFGWHDPRKEFLLSTNGNVKFYDFTEKTISDVNQFKPYFDDITEVQDLYQQEGLKDEYGECGQDGCQLEKKAAIYDIEDNKKIALLHFSLEGGVYTQYDILLTKDENGKWERAFTTSSFGEKITFSLKAVGDFDNNGIKEYMFHLDGYNFNGYALYQEDMNKPVYFGWTYH